MHQGWGGVIKKQLTLVTKEKYTTKKWSVHKGSEDLNKKLVDIKPPAHIPRVPRPLSELPYYKISELKLKAFAVHYSLPIYNGTLQNMYLDHHATLVTALQILNADVITSAGLKTANELLDKYVSYFADLYDEDFLTINFHLLLHLPKIVQYLGPLWVSSCFPHENINGVLLSLVHGTRWVDKQISSSVELVLNLSEKITNLPDGEPKKFCEELLYRRRRKCLAAFDDFEIYGSEQELKEAEPHITSFLSQAKFVNSKVTVVHCIKKSKYLFVALSNRASCQRDSSAVTFFKNQNSEVGIIEKFLRTFHCQCRSKCMCDSDVYAVVRTAKIVNSFNTLIPDVHVPNTHEYELTDNIVVINPKNVCSVFVKMPLSGKLYISKPCNSQEVE
ncbi:Hydroxyacylglutathione hydrolase [Frankliniella fusca]|uniref:Hydroxyacylglutathione hydrolase n=1 Tax=Frankliniella fusca TaxID=407009 RepID=A0AAE1H204_9NEOP|nr:Hydroxyacylglutathione hydrolase [Frankliniella fusca]